MLSARPVGLPLEVDRGVSIKTPGHGLTKTRNVLQENAVRGALSTVIGKGRKIVQNTPLQSKTLQTDHVLKSPPGKQVGPSVSKDTPAIRPLGDKTPFPNRTNQSTVTGVKIAKPALINASLRPSSARKHDRLPRSASKVFETPITNGKHWDVSDIEIKVDSPLANQPIEEQGSYDEIEYMPPKVEDIPYEPPFEMPNYREVGKTLMALIRSYTIEDDPPSTNLTFIPDASESNFFAPATLPQQELEDDSPFARAKPELQVKPQPSTALKQKSPVTSKPVPRPTAQRTTPATRTNLPATSRPSPLVRRSPTTSGVRPSTAVARASTSQPVTRAPTSQSTRHAPPSRATTQAPSVARSAPPVCAATTRPSRATSVSRPTTMPAARSSAPSTTIKGKAMTTRPATAPGTRNAAPALSGMGRPRSGTITKAAFESNAHTHMLAHTKNNSLEEVKKDLEGLIVFEDAFDDDDEFRFDV